MKKQLVTKLRSNEGASFSLALLLFLFCAALSAVIVAAATASVGQYVNQGKADRAYYSALSAAELFEKSLGDEGTRTFTVTQTKLGKQTVTRQNGAETASAIEYSTDDGSSTISFEGDPSATTLDFLQGITYYAFAGAQPSNASDLSASLASLLVGKPAGTWVAPFESGVWATKTSDDITFTVQKPSNLTGANKPAGEVLDALQVTGTGTLTNGWVFDIVFSSGEGSNVQMTIMADVVNYDEIVPVSVNEVKTEGSTETIDQTVRHVKTTEIEWHVERSVAGGGANA